MRVLIVTASGVTGVDSTGDLMIVGALAVAIACGFWWTHFAKAKVAMDRALGSARGALRSCLARDAYSLGHFPILCGVVAYAATIEEATAHPANALPLALRITLAAGVALFVGLVAMVTCEPSVAAPFRSG